MHSGAADDRLRVVLDSNVLVSAFAFPDGVPYQVLQALVQGEILVGISPFILTEVEGVLRDKLRVLEQTIQEALSLLRACCDVIDPVAEAAVSELTPADNRVLDCAYQGGVQYLVTGDRGIRRVETFQGVSIVTPAEFLQLVLRRRSGLAG